MRLRYSGLIILVLIVIDQLVKLSVVEYVTLSGNSKITIIPNFLDIYYIKNYGISFSLFHNKTYLIITAVLIGICLLSFILYKFREDRVVNILISFMIAGALGNFIDRIIHGYVIDYISFTIGSHNFSIFNIADMYIVCSAFILFIYVYFIEKDKYDN